MGEQKILATYDPHILPGTIFLAKSGAEKFLFGITSLDPSKFMAKSHLGYLIGRNTQNVHANVRGFAEDHVIDFKKS